MHLTPQITENRDRPPERLRFVDVEKSFFGVPVLKSVSFGVRAGTITGLVGENGAGKSTLMNLLGGNLQAEAGQMVLEGQPYRPRSSAEARAAGIAFVHQELNLFPNLTVAENLFLTGFPMLGDPGKFGPNGLGWIDRRLLRENARGRLAAVGLPLDPDTPLDRLSAGERQLVELAKELGRHPRLLILDEPTTSLTAPECARLFSLMQQLRADGLALIFISHALGDVLRECDDLVVLRDGAVVGEGSAREFLPQRLVSLMVGRELGQLFPIRKTIFPRPEPDLPARVLLKVNQVRQPGVVRDLSFSLFAGEILGLSGLMGAGRSELARILFGLDPHSGGEIQLEGQPLSDGPRQRIHRGLAFLTEDRRAEGLCLDASIADNIALVTLRHHARPPVGWLDFRGLHEAVQAIRAAVRLTPSAGDGQPVKTLSGGNQQKVVLAKWLLAKPRVLLLDEPTRGIDVGAKFELYQLIHQLADNGAGILVISSELEELLGLCDRILVMSQGHLRDDIPRSGFSQDRILKAALPA